MISGAALPQSQRTASAVLRRQPLVDHFNRSIRTRSIHLDHQRPARVPGSASGKEHVPAALDYRLLDPLDDGPAGSGGLGMAVNQRTTVVVESHHIDAQLVGHVNVIGSKGVVGLDYCHIQDADAGFFQGHLGRWHHGHGHESLLGAGIAVGDQTDLAFLLPPRQRTKARYMAIDAHIAWAQRLIGYHDQGDFSLIGLPCVFSADAWAHLRAVQGNSRIDPLRVLIGQRYDRREALCDALCAHGATAPDDLDDAFWRLADRSYARFLEAFGWVLAYREILPEWSQTITVSKTIQTVLKTRGLSRTTPAAVEAELTAQEPLAAPVAAFRTLMLKHIEQEAAKLPPGVTWLASSDIIESVFGHYKAFTARGPLEEVGRLVLLIPAFLSELTAPLIREAMVSVRSIDVDQWVQTHLGLSMLARRRRALKPDTKTA